MASSTSAGISLIAAQAGDAIGAGFAEVEIDFGHPCPPLEQWFEKRVENPQVGTFRRNNADCGFSQGER
jgi:hypothetical protein